MNAKFPIIPHEDFRWSRPPHFPIGPHRLEPRDVFRNLELRLEGLPPEVAKVLTDGSYRSLPKRAGQSGPWNRLDARFGDHVVGSATTDNTTGEGGRRRGSVTEASLRVRTDAATGQRFIVERTVTSRVYSLYENGFPTPPHVTERVYGPV